MLSTIELWLYFSLYCIIERTDEKITDDSIKDLMISYKTRKHDKTVFKWFKYEKFN